MQSNATGSHIHVISDRQYDDLIILTASEASANGNQRKPDILTLNRILCSLARPYEFQTVFFLKGLGKQRNMRECVGFTKILSLDTEASPDFMVECRDSAQGVGKH